MFNLEKSIAGWRQQMFAAGVKTPVPLDELEIHLREETERLMKSGMAAETAFDSAVHNVGPAHALRTEFEKVEAAKEARNWKLFELLLLVSTFCIPLCVAGRAFVFKSDSFLEMTFSQQLSILTAAVTFSLLAWAMRAGHVKYPVIRTHQIRDAIFVPVLLWVVACIVTLPRCDFTDGQRAVVSMWAFAPFGILIGWCLGFAITARKKAVMAGS
jgi:hypothetical protein